MARVWILRSLRSSTYEEIAFNSGIIAIGWDAVGDLTAYVNRSQTREAVRAAFPFVGRESIGDYTDQLLKFYKSIAVDDFVVLLRRSSTNVAVGQVIGEYSYRKDVKSTVRHIRPVRWTRSDLPRTSVAWLLLDMPTLTMIHRVEEKQSVERLIELVNADLSFDDASTVPLQHGVDDITPFMNFKHNLDYARNLARAGDHLTQLKVGAFEVPDVFRAAWVQAVAALDHWVRQEVRVGMVWLAQNPSEPRPGGFSAFEIPLGEVESILRSHSNLEDVIEEHLSRTRGHLAYQHPDKIRDAFGLISDASDLWNRVAKMLNERLPDSPSVTGKDVREKLIGIVHRRNKIAHESDDDPSKPRSKQSIDASGVSETIEWMEQLAAAIFEVLKLRSLKV